MTIFSRIARIIRANLNFYKPGPQIDENADEEVPKEQASRDNRRRTYRTNADSDSHQDPELAKLYANLEVPYGADLATVTRSWKQLLRQYHPDMHSNNPEKQKIANQLVQELNRSYQELKKNLTQ